MLPRPPGSWGTERIFDQRRLGRLRPRRQARSGGCELRAVVATDRPLLHARRRAQVVLHSGILQRHVGAAVAQPGQRQIRRRHPESRTQRSNFEEPGRGDPRLQRRWLARHSSRERHAAQQALSQQAERNVRGEGGRRRHRLQRRRRGPRRYGRGRRRLRPLRPSQPDDHQLREPDDLALSQRRQRPVRGRSPALGSWARYSGDARIRLLLFRLRQRRLARYFRFRRAH